MSRLAFGRDGKLYVSTFGNAGDGSGAQNPMSHAGKVVRLNDDGSVPGDNPFSGRDGYKPEIYTLGHRSTAGLVVHPATGELWESENGPNGGDEINILKPGANYGWPLVSTGRSYPGRGSRRLLARRVRGPRSSIGCRRSPPRAWRSTPATSCRIGKATCSSAACAWARSPARGISSAFVFNDNWEELRREMLLVDLRQRIRDVRQGPDELLYLLTDEDAGAILRIEPAN